MSGILLGNFKMKKGAKKKSKPEPIHAITRRQSFNGEVKSTGQPPSPLIQQVVRKKGRQEEPLAPSLHSYSKSASLSSLLVNNVNDEVYTGMINGVMDFSMHRGHHESAAAASGAPLDRQGIHDVQKGIQHFVVSITKLQETIKKVATGDGETHLKLQSVAMDRIEDLDRVVNNILTAYPEISANGIRNSLAILTERLKSWGHTVHDVNTWCKQCSDALEALNEAFSQSVKGYMRDGVSEAQQSSSGYGSASRTFTSPQSSFKQSGNMSKSNSKSAENLHLYSMYQYHEMQQDRELTADIDKALLCTENAVEVALNNSKIRTKYVREITAYMSKRASLVADYYRQISKLTKSVREILPDLATESGDSLPLLGAFQQCLDEDLHFARMNNTTFNFQVSQKLVEPIEKRNAECIKLKKELKDLWAKEQKKLSDCKATLKAAKTKYTMLSQEIAKLKAIQMQKDEVGHKQDKRKRDITDIEAKEAKRVEAQAAYKQAVANANDCQYQVHISQKSILCAFRRMVMESDKTLKDCLDHHFEMQQNFFDQFPQRFMALQDQVADFEPGRDFYQHVIRQPQLRDEPNDFAFEEFDPDADSLSFKAAISSSSFNNLVEHDGVEFHASVDSGLHSCETDSPMFARRLGSPVSVWEQAPVHTGHSPQHSTASSSTVSISATPTISPGVSAETQSLSSQHNKVIRRPKNKMTSRPMSHYNVIDHYDVSSFGSGQRRVSADMNEVCSLKTSVSTFNNAVMSKNARTHAFKESVDPNKCRECDNNVYFHGVECEMCGLTCHQKCLEFLMIKCGNKKLQRRIRTFGIDFRKHLEATLCNIPIIVTKCINELDERGLSSKGIYRLSGAKTKMEKLCRLFEVGGDRVDLSDQSPHQIAACLKRYFHLLPEPLLTHALYDDFINCAKNAGKTFPLRDDEVVDELREEEEGMISCLQTLLTQLDAQHYLTLARLLFHLHRVHQHSRSNCMPASNLAIVFGPNLLQPKETQSSFIAIKEMTYQAKAVELLIYYAHRVLNITEEKVKQEENADDDVGTVEAYIPIEQSSEHSYNSGGDQDERLETRTAISEFETLDDERCSNYRLFDTAGSNMEELLHSLYHSARQRLGDEIPLVTKRKSASPDNLIDNDDFEDDISLLPGSMGSEPENLFSLPGTTRSSLPPVEERLEHCPVEYLNSSDGENENDAVRHGAIKSHYPRFSSLHSQSTPHLFVSADNDNTATKTRTSVPNIGIEEVDMLRLDNNRAESEHSRTGSQDSLTESDNELFDHNDNVLSLLNGSPTDDLSESLSRKSITLPVHQRQRKTSSFKRDCPGRRAKRTISLNIPRNRGDVTLARNPKQKNGPIYLSSSLTHLQTHKLSPSAVSLDTFMSGAAASNSDRSYGSATTSPWSTPLHTNCNEVSGDFADDNADISIPMDNETSDNLPLCNNTNMLSPDSFGNERLHSMSTSGSDGLPDGEEKATREENTNENDKMSLECQIRSEFMKVDNIGERLCNLYDGGSINTVSSPSPSSDERISVHEVRLDMRSLSPLTEASGDEPTCTNNQPYHSSSNSTSSTEIHFIHKQHGSTASDQSADKSLNSDKPALLPKVDRIPNSPQRYRRLLAITPTLRLNLSRSTSDVSSDVRTKERHLSSSPRGGFKFSLKRKNSLVLPDTREKENTTSLSRDKSKSTNELYNKDKGRSPFFSGLPKFKKIKSNGRAKQPEVATSTTSHSSPKPRRKKSRTPLLV